MSICNGFECTTLRNIRKWRQVESHTHAYKHINLKTRLFTKSMCKNVFNGKQPAATARIMLVGLMQCCDDCT